MDNLEANIMDKSMRSVFGTENKSIVVYLQLV